MRDHKWGFGAAFTKKYKPLSNKAVEKTLLETGEQARCVELTKTIQLMAERGVENVRGGPYCQMRLPADKKKEIRRLIDHIKDHCFRCHKEGHKLNECRVASSELSEVEPESPEIEPESPEVTPHKVVLPGEPMPRSNDTSPPVRSTIVTTRSSTLRDEHVHIRELPSKNKRRGINRHRCCRIS